MKQDQTEIQRRRELNETIREQILDIRDSGETNMLDADRVQRIAHDRGYYELIVYIEKCRRQYFDYILYGKWLDM